MKIVCYLFFLLGVSSCVNVGFDKKNIDSFFLEVDSLRHTQVICDNYLWGHPLDMVYLDSMIFVFDEKADNGLFHLVDPYLNDIVLDFGEKGQGDNEFIMPIDFQITGKTKMSIYDLSRKSLFSLDLDLIKKGVLNYPVCYKDTVTNTIKVLSTKYQSYLSLGFYEDCMFKLWTNNRKNVKSFGEYPYADENEREIENRLRGMAYQGQLKMNPSNDRCVYAVSSADLIYFYQITSDSIVLRHKYELSYPKYGTKVEKFSMATPMSITNKKTFIATSVTDNYVYVLYSGKAFKDTGIKAYEGNILYVFDWNGVAVKKYILDMQITQFCVNNDNEVYAFCNNPNPTLIKFQMK